jgi:hypothetical protein
VLVGRLRAGIEYNHHIEGDGAEIFAAACRLVTKESSPSAKF